jgi:iron complex outermembrane recepter protein
MHGGYTGAASVLLVCLMSVLVHGVSQAAEPLYELDIPSMSAAEALNRLAEQTGAIMLFPYDLANARRSNAVRGRYTLLEGLDLLLAGTGLSGGLSDKRVVGISPIENAQRPGEATSVLKQKTSFSTRVGAFLASIFSAAASGQDAGANVQTLEEIIVTAQKREERLQDVPVPVTAIGADSLLDGNQLQLQDYYTRVPGLGFQPGRSGEPVLAIRGVTADYGANPAVGVTIDDIPYGASTGLGGGLAAPDIDPSELSGIEVLRGPQGTLYGANSLGGLLKYATVDPAIERVSGHLQAGLATVRHADDQGYNVRGGVNVPLGEVFAVRASGFTRRDRGYIDDVATNQEDVNWIGTHGGRLSALWQPSEDLSLKLGALYQRSERHGANYVDLLAGLEEWQQDRLRGTGLLEREAQFLTAVLSAKLGGFDLTALSGYGQDDYHARGDLSFLAPLFGVAGLALDDVRSNDKFSQEIRLATPAGERFEWMAGAFYTHEKTPATSRLTVVDPTSGAAANDLVLIPFQMTLDEYAAFADLTVHFTDRVDVQFGARQSWIEQDYTQGVDEPGHSTAEALTYMLTPRLRLSPDLMVYARVASGYRPGGPNTNVAVIGVPEYEPDETLNYELGVKGNILGGALSFDASLYHIIWDDLQVSVTTPSGLAYFTNAGEAKSEGVELSFEARASNAFRVAGWVAFNNAELTEPFPLETNLPGAAGDRIPGNVEWSAHLSIEQEFSLPLDATGSIGGMLSYVGDRPGLYVANSATRELYPSYSQLNLRAGVQTGAWSFNLFANNVTDKRAVLLRDPLLSTAVIYIQPRTIGLSIARTF